MAEISSDTKTVTAVSLVKDILSMSRDVAVVVGVYLFFAGFVYRYEYLRYFGLSLSQDTTPIQYFFAYSYLVLNDPEARGVEITMVSCAVGILAISIAAQYFSARIAAYRNWIFQWGRIILAVAVAAFGIWGFSWLANLSSDVGDTNALGDVYRPAYWRFTFAKDARMPTRLTAANAHGVLRLVQETADSYITAVAVGPRDSDGTAPDGNCLFVIPKKTVMAVRLDPMSYISDTDKNERYFSCDAPLHSTHTRKAAI